jgi:dUTP pyrophosphatase
MREPAPEVAFYLTEDAREAGIAAPTRAYEDDAGFDLRALHPHILPAQSITQVHTGVGFEIPSGFYGLICNRTSGGLKGILPVGHVVDAGYTGEIILILYNTNPKEPIHIKANERIAQMVVMPVYRGQLRQIEASEVKHAERGSRRLGSSGSR